MILETTRLLPRRLIPGKRMTSSAAAAQQIVQKVTNFKETQSTRPDFDHSASPIPVTKSPHPDWQYGSGVPSSSSQHQPNEYKHRAIDPYDPSRPMIHNYRLLISGIAPRPIGLLSTVSADGQTKNLAPFSYFQVVDHDPPQFIVGFSSRPGRAKDTYRNLLETGECVINTVSEEMIEAVNAASIDAPYGVSEWEVSGLRKAGTRTVRPGRVQESVLSIEGRVVDVKELGGKPEKGMSVASLVLIKATQFWVREDAVDEDGSHIELEKLRPVAQLGGMSYGRIGSTFEVPRRRWADEVGGSEVLMGLSSRHESESEGRE